MLASNFSRLLNFPRRIKYQRNRYSCVNMSLATGGNHQVSTTLENLHFDNRTVRDLPIDKQEKNFTRNVSGACFSWVKPTPCDTPNTVVYSLSAMQLIGLDEAQCERSEFAEYFSGNKLLPGSQPAAHCYCGHQFGSFAGQLGDGAAMYLGEIVNNKSERWEIQLKGAGVTPYSRSADGRKVLRSSIREFLCSEAMHFLGIPTTRAGCCIVSDSTVVRDIFYDGHPIREKCTMVLRIAETFLRIGSFEICRPPDGMTGRSGPSVGQTELLKKLLDYTISSFYQEINSSYEVEQERYKQFFKEVVKRTAQLVAKWQCVGFCHGVLNTDNTSIVGITIDYGPFGFMDGFNPDYACNASDDGGRYTYKNQPKVLKWNLHKLAEALKDIIPLKDLSPFLDEYDSIFKKSYMDMMRRKLGLLTTQDDDNQLVESFLDTLAKTSGDFTNCFRYLNKVNLISESDCKQEQERLISVLKECCCSVPELAELSKPQISAEELDSWSRNAQFLGLLGPAGEAIMKELSKKTKYEKIMKMKPEEKSTLDEKLWKQWVKMYISRLLSELKNQSSGQDWHEKRIVIMNENNPCYILRNYIAQKAITDAENGDYSEVRKVLQLLSNPFEEKSITDETSKEKEDHKSECGAYSSPPPLWAYSLKVT